MDIFKKLGWFFKAEKKSYITGVSLLFFVSFLSTLVPMIIARIIDGMTDRSLSPSGLVRWMIILAMIGIANYIMRYFWRINIFGTGAKLQKILRQRLYLHFTQMDAQFYQKYRTGDLMTHATQDVQTVGFVAGGGILTLADSIFQGLMTITMMFLAVDWRLSLLALIPIPLLALIVRFNGRQVHHYFRLAQEAFSSLNDKVQESMSGIKVIKTFGEEALDVKDFEQKIDHVVEQNRQAYVYESFFRPAIQSVMGLSTVISLFYGGYLVAQGQITIGLLVAFLNYVSRMGWPMVAVGRLFNTLERGSVSYDRIEQLLKEKSNLLKVDRPRLQAIDGAIEFELQQFTYPGDEKPTLHDVHFKLEKGQTLGVVGKTGAGKSTLFKLLLRDYDQFDGVITYGKIGLQDYDLDHLLSNIGYVPQDNFLFSTSVSSNIKFAVPNASQEQIEQAAKLTDVHEDIIGFPKGYDTLVGERGVALSGGQKQRISMARALIIDPELLILDDSLSAVDAKTEEKILSSIRQNRENKTTIIAAHRLSSIMHADEIIVLDQGTIVERGNHETLLEADGWYKEMYQRQQLEDELKGGNQDGPSNK